MKQPYTKPRLYPVGERIQELRAAGMHEKADRLEQAIEQLRRIEPVERSILYQPGLKESASIS